MKAWRNVLLRFGLVAIPVSLAPTTDSDRLGRTTFEKTSGKRVKRAWTADGATLAGETFEAFDADGTPVVVEVELPGEKEVTLEAYVPLAAVDPLFYDAGYALWAGKGGDDGLGLVAKLLRESDGMMLAGTARFTDRPRSVVIRWSEAAQSLILHTLVYTSSVRFAGMRAASATLAEPDAALLAQASLLTEALPATFLPADVDPLQEATLVALAKVAPAKFADSAPATTAADILTALRHDVESRTRKVRVKEGAKVNSK